MKFPISYLLILCFVVVTTQVSAQSNNENSQPKYFVVNAMGWGFPGGKTSEVLSPKYSTALGLQIIMKDRRFFAYPSLDFLSFKYDQAEHDPKYTYDLKGGRANFYNLNLAAGYRKEFLPMSAYAFFGPGAAVVAQPRAEVQPDASLVHIKSHLTMTPTIRTGLGADYRLGRVSLFVETSWLYQFRQIQNRPVHVITLYGGLKTDITKLAGDVVRVINQVTTDTSSETK
jgi:hypothetical protein